MEELLKNPKKYAIQDGRSYSSWHDIIVPVKFEGEIYLVKKPRERFYSDTMQWSTFTNNLLFKDLQINATMFERITREVAKLEVIKDGCCVAKMVEYSLDNLGIIIEYPEGINCRKLKEMYCFTNGYNPYCESNLNINKAFEDSVLMAFFALSAIHSKGINHGDALLKNFYFSNENNTPSGKWINLGTWQNADRAEGQAVDILTLMMSLTTDQKTYVVLDKVLLGNQKNFNIAVANKEIANEMNILIKKLEDLPGWRFILSRRISKNNFLKLKSTIENRINSHSSS